jgi:hypothetical protein
VAAVLLQVSLSLLQSLWWIFGWIFFCNLLIELLFYNCWTSGSTSLVSNTMGLTVYELPCRVETWYARNQNGGNKGTQNCDLRF